MLEDIVAERRKKLDAIKAAGIDPYPARVKRSFSIAHALGEFEKLSVEAEIVKGGGMVSLVGRLRSLRDMGKIIFADHRG